MMNKFIGVEIISVSTLLAFIAFVFATVSMANSSRYRWEDLTIKKYELEEKKNYIDKHIEIINKAREQTRKDFHYWYGAFFFISSILWLVLLGSLIFLLYKSLKNKQKVKEIKEEIFILILALFTLYGCHKFLYDSYNFEAKNILGAISTYHYLFPKFWEALG